MIIIIIVLCKFIFGSERSLIKSWSGVVRVNREGITHSYHPLNTVIKGNKMKLVNS